MVKISVVIITFNEEKNILRCLSAVKAVADDIVVVDSFSTDRTRELCETNGARVVEHAFEGHIEQKNWAITQAHYPRVLSLDADEVLSETLQHSILEVKKDWPCDGYYFNRLTNYCGKWIRHCGWYPDKKLRLWDSRKGSWKGQNPHDRYEMVPGATTKYLQGDLLHYSFPSFELHLKQIDRFSGISAREKFKKGKKIPLAWTIIRTCVVFIKKYVLKLGILDGYYGYIISRMSAYGTFIKDIKLAELHRQKQA